MSNLSNDTSLPEEETGSNASHKAMLITMILLIAGLTLTGTLMLHYAKAQNSTLAAAATNDSDGSGGLTRQTASLFMKKLAPTEKKETQPSAVPNIEAEDKNSMLNQLFQNRDGDIKWPKLKLTGFGTTSDGGGGFAIINDQQYHVGQLINGKVRLSEVRKHDVLVELYGETKILTVNVTD